MTIQAVLFDLDGTLADTAADLGLALNRLLAKYGKPPFPIGSLRPYASHGSTAFVQMGFGKQLSQPEFQKLRQEYLAEYDNCFDQETELFPQINDMIHAIANIQVQWGIITNKPAAFTDKLVPKLNFVIPPAVVISGDTLDEAKPSTKPMFYACEQIGVQAKNCLYVGDAWRDIEAGRNADMKTVLVNWGYFGADDDAASWGADYTVDSPLQILDIIQQEM